MPGDIVMKVRIRKVEFIDVAVGQKFFAWDIGRYIDEHRNAPIMVKVAPYFDDCEQPVNAHYLDGKAVGCFFEPKTLCGIFLEAE